MEIIAEGKNIPTYQFGRMFTQGELCADTICFRLGRYHSGVDLTECELVMHGLTAGGNEVQQLLSPELNDDGTISLPWKVFDTFTQDPGPLRLELCASKEAGGLMQTVIKYMMQPVYVRPAVSQRPSEN